MRLLALLVLYMSASCSYAGQPPNDHGPCGFRTVYDGTVFTFSIRKSSKGQVTFQLCERKNASDSFLLVRSPQRRSGTDEVKQLRLDTDTYAKLIELYEKALEYNVKDSAMGLDGSRWCLETERGLTYSKACFWSPGPEERAKQRGIFGLYSLGMELWNIANLESDLGKLY